MDEIWAKLYAAAKAVQRERQISDCVLANAIVPFGIDERHKMFYYMGLKEWQQEHQPNRLLDVFLSMQDDMKAVLDCFEILYPHLEQTSRELIAKHS